MSLLVFCRDGILRVRKGVYHRAEGKHYRFDIPLAAMEERWPGMFLSLLDTAIELEDGLDVRETLLNLEPWTREVSALTSCQFSLFLDEVRKPLAADGHDDLDVVGFTYVQGLEAVPEFDHDDDHVDKMFSRIPGSRLYEMRPHKPVITDRLRLGGYWNCSGYKKDTVDFFDHTENGFALDLSPLNHWHHLKLRIINHYWLRDETVDSDYLTQKSGLLMPGHPMVEDVRVADGRLWARRLRLEAPGPTLYSVILKGLVWEIGFHGSPEAVAEARADLMDRTDECAREQIDDIGPDELARREAEIASAIAEEERRDKGAWIANPFDEEDLRLLSMMYDINTKTPDILRTPDGLPPLRRLQVVAGRDAPNTVQPESSKD